MAISEIFKQLGLREDHAQMYLASLQWGETSITNLASKAKLPRTSAYTLVDDMLKLGLLRKSLKRGSKNYVPAQPQYLKELLEKKDLEIQQSLNNLNNTVMNQLIAIQNTRKSGPKLQYLEGVEGIKTAYEMTFNAKEIDIQCLAYDYDILGDGWFDKYFERFFSTNIKSRELLNEGDEEYMKKYGSDIHMQKRISSSAETNTDFMVWDNTVVFVSFEKENPYALIVEDSQIAIAMKTMFDLAWKSAK